MHHRLLNACLIVSGAVLLNVILQPGNSRHGPPLPVAGAGKPPEEVATGEWQSPVPHEGAPPSTSTRKQDGPRKEAVSPIPALSDSVSHVALRSAEKLDGEEAVFLATLQPRRLPAKESLVIPPGQHLRIHVKLADALRARAMADGRLSVECADAGRVQSLIRAAESHGLRFKRVHQATDAELRALERRAATRSRVVQPDLGGLVEAVAAGKSRAQIVAAARELHGLGEVEYAELESQDAPPPPPAADIAPVTPLLVGNQTYRAAATGIDVDHVWSTYGIRGHASLRVTDCEYQYNTSHEDLAALAQVQPGIASMYPSFGDDHGTAVMGVLFAGHNGYGMTGSVPDCTAWFYPEFSTLSSGGTQSRPACVTAAIAASQPGDIVVLEMQTSGVTSGVYVPAEYSLSVFNAVKTGTDAGVIIVAAAGNGGENLDDAAYAAYRARGDSGGIIVGAGNSARARQSYSTYGTRVNTQGWGTGVATTGYGTLAAYGGDANQEYASGFSGTSSATPIVASAAALLQSVAIEICETRLSPAEMRSLLASTGRAQTGDVSKPIGPLPNLRDAVAALLAAHPPIFSTLRSWSLFHFGEPTPQLDADPDGDGVPSILEYVTGTDPESNAGNESSASRPAIEASSNESMPAVMFEFRNPPARTGVPWKVQWSESLSPSSWQDVVPGVGGVTFARTGDVCRFTIPTATHPGGFYLRLHVSAP